MNEKKPFDKDIELLKIQALQSEFQTWFNAGVSLWVAGLVGLLIAALTFYYNKQFSANANLNLFLTLVGIAVVYIVFRYYGIRRMERVSNRFLTFVDKLIAEVEKGNSLGSIMELRERFEKELKSTD
jgi:F0F1-type ATP synthase membrane subunit a